MTHPSLLFLLSLSSQPDMDKAGPVSPPLPPSISLILSGFKGVPLSSVSLCLSLSSHPVTVLNHKYMCVCDTEVCVCDEVMLMCVLPPQGPCS